MTDQVTKARENYAREVEAFKAQRDRVTAAKQELARLEGKAALLTPEQKAARKQASRRAHLLRTRPQLRAMNKTARVQALNALLDAKDAPRVWRFYLDNVDLVTDTGDIHIKSSNRARFQLYHAGLTLGAALLRRAAVAARDVGASAEAQELRDNARTVELHLQSLVDASPREVQVMYPSEWAVISSALRPEGSNPRGKGARKLYALYQHIVRTHREEP